METKVTGSTLGKMQNQGRFSRSACTEPNPDCPFFYGDQGFGSSDGSGLSGVTRGRVK